VTRRIVGQSACALQPKYDFPLLICDALCCQAACHLRPRKDRFVQPPVISIIGDDGSVRAATCNLVRSLGYVVHTFASAEEFLGSPHLNDTSCVIADVRMPTMSGLELQAHLLAEGYRMPFIFVTAFSIDNVRARALKAGATCFLTKPFAGDALINCLDAALQEHGDRMSK
jgi:FixJ family two-component response regulator